MKQNGYYWLSFSCSFLLLFMLRVAVFPGFGKSLEMVDPLWLGLLYLCMIKQWSQAFLWAVLSGLAVMPYEPFSQGVLVASFVLCVLAGRYVLTFVFTQESWYTIVIISGLLSGLWYLCVWSLQMVVVFFLGEGVSWGFDALEGVRFVFVHSLLFFGGWVLMRLYQGVREKS